MQQFEWVHGAWLGMAIVLEIVANVFLKFSDGFRRKAYGVLSLVAVLAAFSALSQAVKGIDLSVAYALWGIRDCRHVGRRLGAFWSASE